MIVRVECYAGYRGEETPRRFFLGERAVDVVEVIDRWLAPDHRYFKVVGDDRATYILRHDVVTARWELTLFERRKEEG
ncbi:MAG: hypothetical protein V3S95_00645 [Alphaproteobacteria bacterium]